MARNTKAVKDVSPSAAPKMKKRYPVKWAILGVVILLIVYAYVEYGNLPVSILSAQLSGQQLNSSSLQTIIFQKVNAMSQATANYSGNITISNDPPFTLSFAKYGNYTRTSLTMRNLPTFGDVSMVMISDGPLGSTNGTMCVNASGGWRNPIMQHLYVGKYKNASETGYKCFVMQGNTTQLDTLLDLFVNVSSFGNVKINTYGLNAGQACYIVTGSGTIDINSSLVGAITGSPETPAAINFSLCLSGQYNIPVSINATLHVPDTVTPYGAYGGLAAGADFGYGNTVYTNQAPFGGNASVGGPTGYTQYFCAGTWTGGPQAWANDANSTIPTQYFQQAVLYQTAVGHSGGDQCSVSAFPNGYLESAGVNAAKSFKVCRDGVSGLCNGSNMYDVPCTGNSCSTYNASTWTLISNTSAGYSTFEGYIDGGPGGPTSTGLAAIGLLNPSSYIITGKFSSANYTNKTLALQDRPSPFVMNYTVGENNSFVLITMACGGSWDICHVTIPNGCKVVVPATAFAGTGYNGYTSLGYDTNNYTYSTGPVWAMVCLQNAGKYAVHVLGQGGMASGAAYDFGPTHGTNVNVALNQIGFVQSANSSEVTGLP